MKHVTHVTKVWFGVCLAGLTLGWVMGSKVGGEFTTRELAASPGVADGAGRCGAAAGRSAGPGPYLVTMLRHNNALLSVAGVRGGTQPPVSPIAWLLLGLAIAVTVAAFALARRAGRRERFVKTRLGGLWHAGRTSAFTVYFALLPQTGRAPKLVPANWFCFRPANARLDTSTGPLQLDLADAAPHSLLSAATHLYFPGRAPTRKSYLQSEGNTMPCTGFPSG